MKHKQVTIPDMQTNKRKKEDASLIEAIPFITMDPGSGKYVMIPKAVQFIEEIPAPLGVMSTVGKYRTGKSYIGNKILDAEPGQGFGVGNTTNAHTRGLWIATKILKIRQEDGTILHMLVMDTEGLGALDANSTHDSRTFALNLLLSSVLLYNSMGPIDEDALENISLITNLAKHLRISGAGGGEEETKGDITIQYDSEMSRYLPTLFWVLRDFSLEMVNAQGEPITSDQYLEQSLAHRIIASENLEDPVTVDRLHRKNKIRSVLRGYFPTRCCVHLVRPCEKESDIQKLNHANGLMRNEFIYGVNHLRDRFKTLAKPKLICGKPINGRFFIKLCREILEAINNNGIPVIQDVCELLSADRCREAMDESLRLFEKRLNKSRGGGEKTNVTILKQEMLKYFMDRGFGEKIQEYRQRLEQEMTSRIDRLQEEWLASQRVKLELKLDTLDSSQFNRWADFVVAYQEMYLSFVGDNSTTKVLMERLWKELTQERIWKWMEVFAKNLVNTKECDLLKEELVRLEDSYQRERKELIQFRERCEEYRNQQSELQTIIRNLEERTATLVEKLTDKETEYTHLVSQHEGCERMATLQEGLQQKCSELEMQLVHLQTTANDAQDELKQSEEEFKQELQTMQQEMVLSMRQAKEMKQKTQQQLTQQRSQFENDLLTHKRTGEIQTSRLTQQEEQLNQLRQKMCEEVQSAARLQRESNERELAIQFKLQQSETKLESIEQRLLDTSKKLHTELQQRSTDKLALLEMKSLHQTVARLEAQNQSLRETNTANQEMMRQALQRSNTLARQLKNQERKQEVATATAQMFSARQEFVTEFGQPDDSPS